MNQKESTEKDINRYNGLIEREGTAKNEIIAQMACDYEMDIMDKTLIVEREELLQRMIIVYEEIFKKYFSPSKIDGEAQE